MGWFVYTCMAVECMNDRPILQSHEYHYLWFLWVINIRLSFIHYIAIHVYINHPILVAFSFITIPIFHPFNILLVILCACGLIMQYLFSLPDWWGTYVYDNRLLHLVYSTFISRKERIDNELFVILIIVVYLPTNVSRRRNAFQFWARYRYITQNCCLEALYTSNVKRYLRMWLELSRDRNCPNILWRPN